MPYFIASALMLTGAMLAVRSFRKEKQTTDNSSYNSGANNR
ncbi:hypothetical protein ABIB62_004126 [Mucilaginibacter sp. UYP25]